MSTIAVRSVQLAGGLRLPYAESGYPGGVPVVFVHGVGESWRAFEQVLGLLPFSLHGYAPSQRGHGEADQPDEGYLPEDYAADLVAFMDALGLERAVLAGAGSGGITARTVAGGHPHRIAGLVLIGTPAGVSGTPYGEWLARAAAGRQDPPSDAGTGQLLADAVHGTVAAELLEIQAEEARRVPARVWRQSAQGLLEADLSATLGGILVPTLAVWGERDARVDRAEQQRITGAIHGSRLSVHQGSGHAVHWERPDDLTRELAGFAAAVAPAGG